MDSSYRRQDCRLTVLEGLEEYRTLMPDLIDETRLEGPSRDMFHNHDICHVIFGCDISLRHEGMVDTWTMFGSDVGIRTYMRYLQLPEVKGLFAQIGFVEGGRRVLPVDAVAAEGGSQRVADEGEVAVGGPSALPRAAAGRGAHRVRDPRGSIGGVRDP